MTERFDFNEALKAIQSGQAISGKDGVLGPLVKRLTEAALEAELDSHLGDDVVPNRKNGKYSETKDWHVYLRPGSALAGYTIPDAGFYYRR